MTTLTKLPKDCTFSSSDWEALAPFWYAVAFSHEVADKPIGVRLLDERLVLYRAGDGSVMAAKDLCLHRGAPLSMGWVEEGELVCAYHGVRYTQDGQCVCIPAAPDAAIPKRLRLTTYAVREQYGLIWVRLVDNGPVPFPEFDAWDDPDYIQIIPDSVYLDAAAGRQIEGFLDVSHFAFVHKDSFGERDNPEVPDYPVAFTEGGFTADYISSVSNLPHGYKHLSPPGFQWRRLFQAWLPFTVSSRSPSLTECCIF